jgi:hypothetical protein
VKQLKKYLVLMRLNFSRQNQSSKVGRLMTCAVLMGVELRMHGMNSLAEMQQKECIKLKREYQSNVPG